MTIIIAIAVGVLCAMALEAHLGHRGGVQLYGRTATLNSLAQGLGAAAVIVFGHLNIFVAYRYLEGAVGLYDAPAAAWTTWLLAFVALDFVFYWGHRAAHASPVLWAMHQVHHQSHEFNFATGVRSPWLQPLQVAPFIVPLALVGVPPEVMIPVYALHQVYKLLVHTRLVGDLGPAEWVFVTPSQHRVHHASAPELHDRNFGGVLSVWDRLFGTYEPEPESLDYGIEHAVGNPLDNNLRPWLELARRR